MSESDEIRLWCWVLGDPHDRVFSVIIKRNAYIEDLKTAIHGQKSSFKDVPADAIDLYKFELCLEDFNEDAPSIHLKDDLKLKSFKRVSFYWVEEPGDVLSIILPRPAPTTITPSSSQESNISPNSPPSWLVEMHRKLWGQRNLLGEIFRTAIVTKGDFNALQELLDAQNPERHSADYVSKDVLATKSAFLRKRSIGLEPAPVDGLVPRPVLGPCRPPSSDAVNEDGIVGDDDDDDDVVMDDDAAVVLDDAHLPNEATAIFPYTIRYVDLTVLQLQEALRVPPLMLYRNEWDLIIDIFNQREKGIKGSALFSGQPGIGKTCMLHSILILCMILAKPVVFQDVYGWVFVIDNTVCPLAEQGVSNDADDVLTLVDADERFLRPNSYIFRYKECRVMETSSPKKKKHREWLIQRVGLHAMFMVHLWSREELVVASLFLESNDITLKRLQDASRICGNIPRECFEAAVSPLALREATKIIMRVITETQELSTLILNMKAGGETVIHHVFQIYPSFKDRLWNSCFVEPVSDWAFSEMMAVLDDRSTGYEFYSAIKGTSYAASLAGRTFEHHLHSFLKRSSQVFTIASLDDSSTTLDIRFTSNTKHFGDKKCLSAHLASSVQSKIPCYFQPLSPVFTAFDSFLYQPGISGSRFSCLIALQVTTALKHPINVKGLEDVQTSLQPSVRWLKPLRPTVDSNMIILFVVPDPLQMTFTKQTIKDGGEVWDRKTAQYVLGLSEEEVFKAR